MQPFLKAIFDRAISVVGFGAILVSMSEFWFYAVDEEVDSIAILIAYGLLGLLFLMLVQRHRIATTAGFVTAAALLGFLIEGVPVPVMYSAPPMTIVWTSLAWHALISVGIGWVMWRHVLQNWGLLSAGLFNAALGLFLGLWNSYMWNGREAETPGEVAFDWQPLQPFVEQFLFGYVLFLGGHILFDRFFPRGVRYQRSEHLALWGIAAAISLLTAVASGLIVLYPILPALVLLCLLALRQGEEGTNYVDRIHAEHIPLPRFLISALIPITAIATYAAVLDLKLGLEMNVPMILIAGPVSTGLFLWGLYRQFGKSTA